jgi:type I restriction enzyme S subunit
MISGLGTTAKIGELCDFSSGNGFKASEWSQQGIPIIRIQNLNGSANFNYYAGTPDPRWIVEPGELLFAWAGVKGVSFGPTLWNGETGLLNQHIYRVRPREGVDKRWLFAALKLVTSKIEQNAHGFKTSLVHVRKADIENAEILLPPIPEQRKIAEILSGCDEAVELQKRLIEAKQNRKKALMRELLSGHRRFPVFRGTSCRTVPFHRVVERITRRNRNGCFNVLTSSGEKGLVAQMTYFSKSVAGRNLKGYTIIEPGEFAYNRSSSDGYPFGAIKRLDRCSEGLLSTLYICFKIRDTTTVDSDFLLYYCEAGLLNNQLRSVCQEGARSHGLLNISLKDFFSLSLLLPSYQEQKQISKVLTRLDEEIGLLEQQLEAFKDQKRGLMEVLLTGKVRVKF